jgi:ZIP family zinc transporter
MSIPAAIALSGSLGPTVRSTAVVGCAPAFSVAALLYLVIEELLVEAHREEKAPFSTLVIFAGFLAFWCVSLFGQGI